MSPVDDNMQALQQAVMSEAQAEADRILSEANAKAESIRQNAREQAEAERKRILERASQEAERIRRQAIATAQIKARTIQLEHRENILAKVFDATRGQLSGVQQWSDYDHIASDLLREGIRRLESSSVKIHADEATLQCLTKETLEKISKETDVKVKVNEPLKKETGVIVESEDGRRRYDNTLETRLSRMQDELRSPVYHLLMGESQ